MKRQPKSYIDVDGSIRRYRHDLEQALAMEQHKNSINPKTVFMAPNSKAGTSRSHTTKNTTNLSPTSQKASDITLGFRGLDEAERQKDSGGNKEAALKLYSQSIELLLRYLRPSSSSSSHSMLDQELTVRVHKALDEAEQLKKSIEQEKQQHGVVVPSSSTKNNKSSYSSSTRSSPPGLLSSSSLPSLFRKKTPDNKNIHSRANHQTQQEQQKMSSFRSLQTVRQNTSKSKSNQPSPTHTSPKKPATNALSPSHGPKSTSSTTTNKSRQQRQLSPPPQSPDTQKRKPLLDYSRNDPLVQIIKEDLYVDPSQLQGTTWDDIAGLSTAKQLLQEAAIFPLIRPDLFTGLRKPQNVLLYGPPGTGKTMLVRAVAHESKCILFCCTSSALTSKWHGEGEKLIRTLFRMAHDVAPSILFLDEMDALLSSRTSGNDEHEASRRFKTEFMVQMDGIVRGNTTNNNNGKNASTTTSDSGNANTILVIGATNCPWDVDDAVMRRFPRRIYIPLPDEDARRALLQHLLKKAGKHNLAPYHVSSLIKSTNGFSCSDITSLASDAAFGPLRSLSTSMMLSSSSSPTTTTSLQAIQSVKTQDIRPITIQDFQDSLQSTLTSVSPSLLSKYKTWEQQKAAK